MPTSASTEFQANIADTVVNSVTMTLVIDSIEYTEGVQKFPAITRDSRKVVGGDVQFSVHRDQTWIKTIINSKAGFGTEGIFSFGFTMAPGSKDTIDMFKGQLTNVNAKGSTADIVFSDKFLQLNERKIGNKNSPEFTNLDNPADQAWLYMVSWGDLDPTQSAANPDIDYNAWSSWHSVFSNDSVEIKTNFEGESVTEALQKIAELTDSSIYQTGNGKVFCQRLIGINSVHGTITDSFIIGDVEVDVKKEDIVNKCTVLLDYDFVNDEWDGEVTIQNTASINSWGIQEKIYDDTNVWYVSSAVAITHAERIINRRYEPNTVYKMELVPKYLLQDVGDVVAFTSNIADVASKYVVLQQTKNDLQGGKFRATLDEGLGRSPAPFLKGFVLDDAVLGLLDQDYNPLIG